MGLITTDGPHGADIMACEWTHFVSYSPGLIAVCIGPGKATVDNIRASKFFGVNLASGSQNVIASVAGSNSGKDTGKMAALIELGHKFYTAKEIGVQMVEGASLNVECRLVQEIALGDHIMFVGEALNVSVNPAESVVYHAGKYWALGAQIGKPAQNELERIGSVLKKHKKK